MRVKNFLLFSFIITKLFSDEDIEMLLKQYRSESELSKITEKESAGLVNIFTRDDLEKMQAHTLLDVLKTIPILNLTRSPNNIYLFSIPTLGYIPLSTVRLYINDHDMTSSSFGSALPIWGDMPIEYIDHIEIYKGSSSIEFGNEAGIHIIKLYTKKPEREEGGKLRVLADTQGSYDSHLYYANTTTDNLSWFTYINKDDIARKKYEHLGQELNSDKKGSNFYTNILYNRWRIEVGNYEKSNNSFLGRGRNFTPEGGGLNSTHQYVHLTKNILNDYKLQIAYDKLDYNRRYIDENIPAGNAGFVSDYNILFKDSIFTIIGEKYIKSEKNSLLIGTFYKYKYFKADGKFDSITTEYENGLNLYSLYIENQYKFDDKRVIIASLKEDLFRYNHDIKSQNELIARLGYLQSYKNWKFKLFLIKTYIPISFYKLYSENKTPFNTNTELNSPQMILTTASIKYKYNQHSIIFKIGQNHLKNNIVSSASGFINANNTIDYQRFTLEYTYKLNQFNRYNLTLFTGNNDQNIEYSPKYGAIFHSFNTYGKFDIYNEIDYKSSYEYADLKMKESIDYTFAIKYHLSNDLSIGVRGENVFGTGFKQAYNNFPYAIPVIDRKFWINLEYLF